MSSDSEGFESADEDLVLDSDSSDEKIETSEIKSSDSKFSVQKDNVAKLSLSKLDSDTVLTTKPHNKTDSPKTDSSSIREVISPKETLLKPDPDTIVSHERIETRKNSAKHDFDFAFNRNTNQGDSPKTNLDSVKSSNDVRESENIKDITEKAKVANTVTAELENAPFDDNSSGWDFEEDDLVLPDSPEKKAEHVDTKGERAMTRFDDFSKRPDNLEKRIDNSEEKIVHREKKNDSPTSKTKNESSGWPVWGNWGVTNLINTASEGVSQLSLQMTSGLSSVLENTLGAPDPQELAQQVSSEKIREDKVGSHDFTTSNDLFGFGNILGGVSNLGSKVISGGLDTLETLGKKTMEVLQEGDPGFKKKRAIFQGDKVILSQILREAKDKAEELDQVKERDSSPRKAQYETLFDDFHGLVHLEALEMISKQCEIKLETLISKSTDSDSMIDVNGALNNIKLLFDQQNFNDDSEESEKNLINKLNIAVGSLALNINTKSIGEVESLIESRLDSKMNDASDIHTKAISDLAQFTACSIELFHRIAELHIVKDGDSNTENDFQALVSITCVTKSKIGSISERYSDKIMNLSDKSHSPLITNIFLEASNSGTYLENAFELFLPILQLGAIS